MAPLKTVSAALGALCLLACSNEPGAPMPPPADPPAITEASTAMPAGNVLSATLGLHATGAEHVSFRYRPADSTSAESSVSPSLAVVGDSAVFLALGLLPATRYVVVAVAEGPGGTVWAPMEFTTGALPADLPVYSTVVSGPVTGFTVFNSGNYGIVIDSTGRVVWYRHFPGGVGLNFQALANGHYATQPHTPDPNDLEPWVEVDPAGAPAGTFGCANALAPRFHDAISDGTGGHWLMCDEVRTMDLSGIGGQAAAKVTGTVIQHVDASGALLFEWSAFDHFALTDLPLAERTGAVVNWTHGNAIALDADGNLLVSFRSLSEITRISTTTGAVLWRLGGLANQFTFSGAASPPFTGQHGLRPTSTGLLLLDNRGEPGESRAERYRLDETTKVATLVESFSSAPSAVGLLGGSVQQLADGHVLVSLGNGQKVEEYDAAGNVVWQLHGGTGYIFRAQRIASLYAPGVGTPR